MTLNNHRFTTLSADDVAMCRAHSKAVHEQSTNTTTAAGRDEIGAIFKTYEPLVEFEAGMHMPDDPPLPPSYWDDLEHWLKTLAPAKPAAPRPDPATAGMNQRHAAIYAEHVDEKHGVVWRSGPTIPEIERVGLWHYKTVSDGTVGVAEQGSSFSFDCPGEYRPAAPGTKYGDPYDESKYATADLTARIASTSSADGAALVGVKLTHSVCIKAHAGHRIGKLLNNGPLHRMTPECWLPCDKDGWIPHAPTADAVCPVPPGVHFEILLFGGGCQLDGGYGGTGDCNFIKWDAGTSVIAWRPITDDRK